MIINNPSINFQLDESIANISVQETLQGYSVHITTLPFECRIRFLPKLIKDLGRFGKDQNKELVEYLNYWNRELSQGKIFEVLPVAVISRKITGVDGFEKLQEVNND